LEAYKRAGMLLASAGMLVFPWLESTLTNMIPYSGLPSCHSRL
jgi:hypothetical protein